MFSEFLDRISEFALTDWSASLTILGVLISLPTYYLSKDFHRFASDLLNKPIFRLLLISLLVFLAGWFVGTVKPSKVPEIFASTKPWPPEEGILARIIERGKLNCGVNTGFRGFGNIIGFKEKKDQKYAEYYDQAEGFDVDFCKAIAAAIFGSSENRVRYLHLEVHDESVDWKDRFSALTNGYVDVLIRNTSATVRREISREIEFGPTIFFDGQSFISEKNTGLEKISDILKKNENSDELIRICVGDNTTHTYNLKIILQENLNIPHEQVHDTPNGKPIQSSTDGIGALNRQHCDLYSADHSALMSLYSENPTRYDLFDEIISNEMLSPAYIKGDQMWSDVVRYTIYATIEASRLGIGKETIDSLENLDTYERQFLGDIEMKNIYENLDLEQDFVSKIINDVGNYDDIFVRNLVQNDMYVEKRGPNQIWLSCDKHEDMNHEDSPFQMRNCGQLIAPPF